MSMSRARSALRAVAAASVCVTLAGCNTAQTDITSEEVESLGPARCPTGQLTAAGTSVQRAAIDEVGGAYAARCDNRATINYQASGSAAGITAFTTGDVDWAGSDAPLDADQQAKAGKRCTAGEAWSLPLVTGPIAVVVNLPGIDRVSLTPVVLGRILEGGITRWDDPAIGQLNPGVRLPGAGITVIARGDVTGMNRTLTDFLASNGAWPADRVSGLWSGVGERQDGPTEVLAALRGTSYSLGFTEGWAARANGLTMVEIDNGAGPVAITPLSVAKGIEEAEITGTGPDLQILPRYAGSAVGAYPLQMVSYEVVCTKGLKPAAKAALLRDFLGFLASDQQQEALGEFGYSPLPKAARKPLREAIRRIQ